MFRKINAFIFALILTSCSMFSGPANYGYLTTMESRAERFPASSESLDRLEVLLAIDKLDYYIGEYINGFGKNIDESSLSALKQSKIDYLIEKFSSDSRIFDAKNYDGIVYEIIEDKLGAKPSLAKSKYVWGYNFFKNKLNEGFTLLDTKLKTEDKSALTTKAPTTEEVIADINFKPDDLTLDSGLYISNRTTRAVFWEATESGRGIDFHLENSREFLKNLSENGASVVKEVRPFANNYNKIYIVQYPGEDTYRYAITSIGGKDRLNHLLLQFGLSKLEDGNLKNKVRIYGDVDKSHKMMEDELSGIMKHLPKANRVIIGQKGAIERTVDILWKVRALKNLYDSDPDAVLSQIVEKDRDAFVKFLKSGNYEDFDIFKNKKQIEVAFEKVKAKAEKSGFIPPSFKKYDYDNFVISMSDIAFQNKEGENIVWRVVANSWGDEIAPLARALKNTGHKDITYIGTAGAFPEKGYKVGDLVIPTHARIGDTNKKLNGDVLQVDGAKIGGVVDHVFSPFQETEEWLQKSKQVSDFVEVETSHLREILNSSDDHMRAYLLISDVLKSEGETLASATSAKRRNALNKLLISLFDRDNIGIPKTADLPQSSASKLRDLIDAALAGKGNTFKYYVFSALKDSNVSTAEEVVQFAESVDSFSDHYFTKRLALASEVSSYVGRKLQETGVTPKISISKDFVQGKWNPKGDILAINFHAASDQVLEEYKKAMEELAGAVSDVDKFTTVNLVRGPPESDVVTVPKFLVEDSDYLVDVYSQAAFRSAGLDAQVTYNGNLKYNFLPTTTSSDVCDGQNFCHLAFFSPDGTTKNLLDEVNTVAKLKSMTGVDAIQAFETTVTNLNGRLTAKGTQEDFLAQIQVSKNASFTDGKLAEIVPKFDNQKGLIIEVNFSAEGWKNPLVILEEMTHLKQIVESSGFYKHPIFWAEVALNAEYGSKRSKLMNARAEVDAMDALQNYFNSQNVQDPKITEYIAARKAHAAKISLAVSKEEKAERKTRKGIAARWKTLHTKLEAEDLKLDDYIASNNRKKVVELVEAYMPWEEMEPTEIAAWTRWLDAIEKPATNEADYMMTFRGVADDLVRETDNGGYFLMSKLLTKNQGSYTRRLRSLKTFFGKKLSKKAQNEMPIDFQSLAAIFKGHSHEPVGSPFLSTSVMSVAQSFAGHPPRIAAMKIDKRRNLLNLVSGYHEVEEMVPLIVFPDEIIHLESTSDFASFKTTVEGKIGRSLSPSELQKNQQANLKLEATKEWWNMINPEGITSVNATKTCKDVIKMFMGI
ncbi:hypothetical protein [Bacteriovorax sp. Seq25_V]|uniref:hypothetical protein n=1 Tax=Bacteriovorax sp. Seq25_V TaxID=1201288 RepID=UPI000389F56A|nr:hypothetical protein [Bacteriovorax sp. Seq25_V]EQC44669.1 putative lipoprotein [Bacteriovorax sp. Seq25_V]